jgi:hypothetical protein
LAAVKDEYDIGSYDEAAVEDEYDDCPDNEAVALLDSPPSFINAAEDEAPALLDDSNPMLAHISFGVICSPSLGGRISRTDSGRPGGTINPGGNLNLSSGSPNTIGTCTALGHG